MSVETPLTPTLGVPVRPWRRASRDAVLGGVCSGLAIRLGLRERSIRVAVALLTLVVGLGLPLYTVAWLVVPRAGEEQSIAVRLIHGRWVRQALIGVVALFLAWQLVRVVDGPTMASYTWPLAVSAVGLLAVWRGASADERRHLGDLLRSAPLIGASPSRSRWSYLVAVVLGWALVYVGVRSVDTRARGWHGITPIVLAALILVTGFVVLLAPWWLSTVSALSGEHRERVRSEERARMAAHLHDSVLQTLTLIERSAGDEAAVRRLARTQERELREWLFEPEADAAGTTFGALILALQAEIERDYGVVVEVVRVGDVDVDDHVVELVAAGREALINAARWSGVTRISLFGEVEGDTASLFVRDTGVGFDLAEIAGDRHGIEYSIRQRMAQCGGTARITSAVGRGTEVEVSVKVGERP